MNNCRYRVSRDDIVRNRAFEYAVHKTIRFICSLSESFFGQGVNRGLRESWLKGNATGGHPPYGYIIKDKKYVIDEAEAEVVREIFMKYAQGYKAVAIAEDLKARNVHHKCGKYINHKYVYVILHDKRYIGEVTHQGTTYYNIFPPIIAKEVWNQVDAINQENKISPSRKKEIFDYILSGKLICGNCKHRMSGESGTSRKPIMRGRI